VVDDYEPFRRVVTLILEARGDLRIVGEVSDGLEAVQKAKALRPDVVLLDIDLPTLNGIQVARRLRDALPRTKILFVSVHSSPDILEGALDAGGAGYVHKLNVGSELLLAIDTVLRNDRFVSSDLGPATKTRNRVERHEMIAYSGAEALLESASRFIGAALKTSHAGVVLATHAHRSVLLEKLQERGLDVAAAIKNGSLIAQDAVESLAPITVKDPPDYGPFFDDLGRLIKSAGQAAKARRARVAVFGECVGLLYAQGRVDHALAIEKIGNELIGKNQHVDMLCAYPILPSQDNDPVFKRICAEHSSVSFL